VKKEISEVKIVINGVGAAGTAVAQLLYHAGVRHMIGFDINGVIHKDSPKSDEMRSWFIEMSNHKNFRGTLSEALNGADVFIGVSVPNVLSEKEVQSMAKDAIVFALANPDPEIDPEIARRHVRVVATGRSDQPNQINNVLAFPGVFRGLLDIGATKITDDALLAAADAIANCVRPEQLNESFIIPSVFDPAVTPAVASAIKATCR
jgi:malate dehydrogenase (oxaloacetate-decarboxylating)